MNLNFGIPLKRQPKQEKYSFPVLTMQKEPEIKKGARRFLLNKAAFELLGLNPDKTINETLSVGFPQHNNGNFVIAVTTDNENVPNKFKYMIHKTENSFSDLTLYTAIQNELLLDNTNDVEFKLEKSDNIITFKLLDVDIEKQQTTDNTSVIENGGGIHNTNTTEGLYERKSVENEEIIAVEVEEENVLTLN